MKSSDSNASGKRAPRGRRAARAAGRAVRRGGGRSRGGRRGGAGAHGAREQRHRAQRAARARQALPIAPRRGAHAHLRGQAEHLVDLDLLLLALDRIASRAARTSTSRAPSRTCGWLIRIWPGLALDSSRAARFTLSPITVYSIRSSVPTVPATASPRAHADADRDRLLAVPRRASFSSATPCLHGDARCAPRGWRDRDARWARRRPPSPRRRGTCPGSRRA